MRQHGYDNGWTAAPDPARLPGHNLHYTQQGLWIPVATRIAMAPPRPHIRMKMAYFHSNDGVGLPDFHLGENNG